MSLLCRECDAPLAGSYQILCLLGHTKTGLVHPQETPIRQLVCHRHIIQPFDKMDPSRFQEADADALIFAVVPGIPSEGGNFNSAYSMAQAGALKENGDFDQAVHLTSVGVRTAFPASLESLLIKAPSWPDELMAYKTSVAQYRADMKQVDFRHTQRQQQEKADKQKRICENERVNHLRQQHVELIRSVAENAITNRTVPPEMVRQLNAVGLLRLSTKFRSSSIFPGEATTLWYDFTEKDTRHAGYIGFDSDLQLLSVDERFPKNNQVYLRT